MSTDTIQRESTHSSTVPSQILDPFEGEGSNRPRPRMRRTVSFKQMFSRFHLSEGILLGGITGLGYFSAYLSDIGYKSYYGLPSLYADVNLNTMILSFFSLVLVFWTIAIATLYPSMQKYGPFVLPWLIPLVVAGLVGLRLDFHFVNPWPELLFTLLIAIIATGAMFYFAYSRKWVLTSIFFIGLVIYTARLGGVVVASNQTEYLVTQTDKPYVVIDTYKDSLIMMPVDLKKRVILPEFRFVDQKAEMDQAVQLKKMKIGPLKVDSIQK